MSIVPFITRATRIHRNAPVARVTSKLLALYGLIGK